MVAAVYNRDIRIGFDGFFRLCHINGFCNRQFQIDVIHVIIAGDFRRSSRISAIIQNQNFLPLRNQGVDTSVNINGTGAGKQHRGVFIQIAVDDLYQIFSHLFHNRAEFLFSRADIRNHLRVFYRIRGRSRTGIEQYISFYFRIFHFSPPFRAILFCNFIIIGHLC